MSHIQHRAAASLVLALVCLSYAGCIGITQGPQLGFLGVPIPVSPYFQWKKEQEY
jgi:hypothetical protein